MLNTIPPQKAHTPISDDTSTLPTFSRVLTTLLVLGAGAVVGVLITFPMWFLSMIGEPGEAMDKAEAAPFFYLMLVPIAIAGAYWLSLFRLRRVEARRTWLEALGFSFVFLLGIHILLGVGAYVLQLLHLPSFGDSSNPWAALVLYVQTPALILYALLEALVTSGIALGVAAMFTDWYMMRDEELPRRRWLEFLLVFGCATLAAFLTGLAFVYVYAFLQDAFVPILVFVLIPVPGAILASIASWTTYRTLQKAKPVRPTRTGTASEA